MFKIRRSKKGWSNSIVTKIVVNLLVTCPVYLCSGKHLAWRHCLNLGFDLAQQLITTQLLPLRTKYAIYHLYKFVRYVLFFFKVRWSWLKWFKISKIAYLGFWANFCWKESYSRAFKTTRSSWGQNCYSSRWPFLVEWFFLSKGFHLSS